MEQPRDIPKKKTILFVTWSFLSSLQNDMFFILHLSVVDQMGGDCFSLLECPTRLFQSRQKNATQRPNMKYVLAEPWPDMTRSHETTP